MPREPRARRGVIFGSGGVARQAHLPGYALVRGRLQVAGVVDGARSVPAIEGLPRLYDREEIGRLGPIDFVDICTPTSSHLELTLWALERGYHVLCEKPVALTRDEAARIAAAARAAGRVVVPCHQYRFNPAWLRLREWLSAGHIGAWRTAELRVYRPHADGGAGPQADVPWRGTAAHGRGGVLLDHGTHLVYLALDVAGAAPSSVEGWTRRLRHRGYDVEDTARVRMGFGGRSAEIFVTWAAGRRENRITFVGERGRIEWRDGELRLESAERTEREDFRSALDKATYKEWFARLFAGFADAMDEEVGARPEIAAVAGVLEQAYGPSIERS